MVDVSVAARSLELVVAVAVVVSILEDVMLLVDLGDLLTEELSWSQKIE